MAKVETIERLFNLYDQGAQRLKEKRGSYLEGLIIFGESVAAGEVLVQLPPEVHTDVEKLLRSMEDKAYSREEVRRAFQLAVLKGLKEQLLPVGAIITPDAVSLLIANLVSRFLEGKKQVSIVDLGCGSGNLLTAVLNHLPEYGEAYGIDIDPLLARLAYVNANLQQHEIQLFRQDALERLFFTRVDAVISDLPVGQYENREKAKFFDLYSKDTPCLIHHLLIEQALYIAQEGAYLFFVIPNTMFTDPGAGRLRQLITEESYIQALLELPENLFQEGSVRKSIFILQKKGEGVTKPPSTLLARLPSLSDGEQMRRMWQEIEEWLAAKKEGREGER